MYVISGKGTTAGVDLASYIYLKCQEGGILFDDDFPEYTLDFLSQIPSISKSIREGKEREVIDIIQKNLNNNEKSHTYYILLCFTAHKLIKNLKTNLININLVDLSMEKIKMVKSNIAYLGTKESLPLNENLILHPNHIDIISDLILSIKRGYSKMGDNFPAHPKNILKKIVEYYRQQNIDNYFIACTDLHICKKYLVDLGIPKYKIIDIIETAGDKIISLKKKNNNETSSRVDSIKEAMRIKYLQ